MKATTIFFIFGLALSILTACQSNPSETSIVTTTPAANEQQNFAATDTVTVLSISPVNDNRGVLDQQHVFTGKCLALSSGEFVETFLMRREAKSIHSFNFAETDHVLLISRNGANITLIKNLTLAAKLKK